jgi:hypothetical protein
MKKCLFVCIAFLAISHISCRAVIKKWYGVKKPAFETTQSIEEFKNKVFGPQYNFAVVSYNNWIKNDLFEIPDMFVFDSKGRFIPYKDSSRVNCNGPADMFISLLDPKNTYNYSPEFSKADFVRKLEFPNGVEPDNDTTDFYIFITWTNWAGQTSGLKLSITINSLKFC